MSPFWSEDSLLTMDIVSNSKLQFSPCPMPNHSEVSPESASPNNKFNLSTAELKEMAKKLRRHVITMTATAGSGHPGGSLSAADIITALYFKVLRYNPENP